MGDGPARVGQAYLAPRKYDSPADALAHVKRLRSVEMERLWEHLLYAKGLLPYAKVKGEKRSETDKLRDKVADVLAEARGVLVEGGSNTEHLVNAITPGTFHYEERPEIRERLESAPRSVTLQIADEANACIKKAESILSGKLLRAVSAWIEKSNGGHAYRTEPLYLERSIGRVNVVFEGSNIYTPGANPTARSAREFNQYTRYFVEAKRLLESKGLGAVWYGPIFISCQSCGGENRLGANFGLGADYDTLRDDVRVYDYPSPDIVRLLVHELGHRYYFKFMSAADRARFDSHFGTTKATTDYGAADAWEDFAEAFMHFVLEREMTRDQIDRFKAFLARKERRRFLPNKAKKPHRR